MYNLHDQPRGGRVKWVAREGEGESEREDEGESEVRKKE